MKLTVETLAGLRLISGRLIELLKQIPDGRSRRGKRLVVGVARKRAVLQKQRGDSGLARRQLVCAIFGRIPSAIALR